MTTPAQRLGALEERITPQQAVLRYLVEFVACDTMEGYLQWAFDDALIKKMKDTHAALGRQAIAGIPKQDVRAQQKAKVEARREFNGLFQLAYLPVSYVEENRYRWLYEVSTLIQGINLLFNEEESLPLLGGLCQKAKSTWADLLGFMALVEQLQTTVFDGLPILLPTQQRFLEEQRDTLSRGIQLLSYLQAVHACEGVSLSPEDLHEAAEASQASQYERLTLEVKVYLLKDESREREGLLLERQCLKDRLGIA